MTVREQDFTEQRYFDLVEYKTPTTLLMSTLELDRSLYKDAALNESRLIACLVRDRKLCRLRCMRRLKPSDFADQLWSRLFAALMADPWTSVEKIARTARGQYGLRMLAEAIDDAFLWNVRWHAHEVRRLAAIRRTFSKAVDFLVEHVA